MGNIGPLEIILILVVALLVFGPKRLPEIGRSVGRGMREFRRASSDLREEFERAVDVNEPAPERDLRSSETAEAPVPQPPATAASARKPAAKRAAAKRSPAKRATPKRAPAKGTASRRSAPTKRTAKRTPR